MSGQKQAQTQSDPPWNAETAFARCAELLILGRILLRSQSGPDGNSRVERDQALSKIAPKEQL